MMSPAIWAKKIRCIGGDLGARAILLTLPVEEWQQAHVLGRTGTTTSTSAHCCWAVCKLKQTMLLRAASPTASRKMHGQSKQRDQGQCLVKVVQQLPEQVVLSILEASSELSWHKCSFVWKRNMELTNIVNRKSKKKNSSCCSTVLYYFQGCFFTGWEINSELFRKLFIFSPNMLFYYLPFCCWFSFFFLFFFLNPFNHLLDLLFSSVHFFFATLSPAFHR